MNCPKCGSEWKVPESQMGEGHVIDLFIKCECGIGATLQEFEGKPSIVILDRCLNDEERTRLYEYLKERWKL